MSFEMILSTSPYREIFFIVVAMLLIGVCLKVVKTTVKVGFGIAALIALLNAFGNWSIFDILHMFGN